MHETVRNLSPKLVWLRLNSGEYVGIRARGSRSVDKARLERNPAYDKLRKRGVIAVVAKEQEKKKKKARTADKKKAAKDKPEDAQIEARADAKKTPPRPRRKNAAPRVTGVKKKGRQEKKKGKQ